MVEPTHRIRALAQPGTPLTVQVLVGLSFIAYSTAAAPQVPQVRTNSPVLAGALARGTEHSATFRRLVEDIAATDGLVYVLEGECGQGIRACLHMSLELSGPYRLLRVLVNPRRARGCEIIVSIGHELQHALEALRNPRIRDRLELFSFFHQIGQKSDARRFETPEAVAAGVAVEKEICGRR